MLAIAFFYELQYVDQFCLKSFSLFSTEGLRDREQLHVQERHSVLKLVGDAIPWKKTPPPIKNFGVNHPPINNDLPSFTSA